MRLIESLGVALARSLAVTLAREQKMSLRDVGRILELSHQRVAQLLEEHDALGGDERPELAYYVETLDQWSNRKAAITIRAGDGPEKLEQARAMVHRHAATGRVAAKRRRNHHPPTGRDPKQGPLTSAGGARSARGADRG